MQGGYPIVGVWLLCAVAGGALAGCAPGVGREEARDVGVVTPVQAPDLMTWAEFEGRSSPSPTTSVVFGTGATDIADLWLPEGPGPHKVVLMVHGGCWQKSVADRTLMNHAAEDLRKRGLAVWNIEYRGVDEAGGGYPGTFLDVARAADALRSAAAEHNLKIDRVAAFGHSAGGHLALWLAARPNLPVSSPLRSADPLPIAGVVNAGGLADLEASTMQADCLLAVMDRLTGAPDARRADVMSDTSPARLLPTGVRLVNLSGEQDHVSPPALARGLARKAAERGDEAEAVIVPATGHVELISPGTAAFEQAAVLLLEMLR